MRVLRLILVDQLNQQLASLRDINIETDIVLMAEVGAEVNCVKHHKCKIAFFFATMWHFAEALLSHSIFLIYRRHIGFYLNAGLLLPAEVIAAAETAYNNDNSL